MLVVGLSANLLLQAQRQTLTANTNLYFPQLADGGPKEGQWQTTFTFTNTSASTASLSLYFFDNYGSPLALDFGSGAKTRQNLTLPSAASTSLRSRMASTTTMVGWAIAYSSVPVQATSSFRLWIAGKATQEVTAPPTLPALDYISYANRNLGVALANPSSTNTISIDARIFDSNGTARGNPARITLPPYGHTSFNLSQQFANIGAGDWTLSLSGVDKPDDMFVAWTLNADDSGTFSSLPNGSVTYPLSHWDRIWNVYLRVLEAAERRGILSGTMPNLVIRTEPTINAYASNGTTVGIYLGLSELINDSDSELAAVVGHELGHIYQQRNGNRLTFNSNAEIDADIQGALLALFAGYDPYGAAGALAKLAMATGQSGLAAQFEAMVGADAHGSFNTRLQSVFDMLVITCNYDAESKRACSDYKSIFHPHFPQAIPLSLPAIPEVNLRF